MRDELQTDGYPGPTTMTQIIRALQRLWTSPSARDNVIFELAIRYPSILLSVSELALAPRTIDKNFVETLTNMCRNGMKIQAIKLYREVAECGLVEAKRFVDQCEAGQLKSRCYVRTE